MTSSQLSNSMKLLQFGNVGNFCKMYLLLPDIIRKLQLKDEGSIGYRI